MTPILQKRWPWLAAGAAIVIAFLSTVVQVDWSGDWDRRPTGTAENIAKLRERDDVNVLFVLIDTLRSDRLGSYGYERDTSPTLDRLASSGVRFARNLAQSSWTKCSMASLWTGLYPARSGITRFDDVVPPEAELPGEIFQRAGFQTVGLYRNGWVAPTFGFDQGFEVYRRPSSKGIPADIRIKNPTLLNRGTDEDVVDAALEFLRLEGDKRWFLYLHLMDVHEYLYDEESALFGSSYSDVYDNSIRWTDGVMERLLAWLQEFGYLDKTLVVIGSDHGEAFRERGFEGHARKVFKETTEVPFLIFFPFRLEPGIVVDNRTRNVDVWPTVLDLVGLEAPEGIDGRSRVPDILAAARGEPLEDSDSAIAHLDQTWGRKGMEPQPTVAVAQGGFRYVRIQQGKAEIEQLFDARDDPMELQDRSEEEPEAMERLSATATEYLEQEPPWGEAPTRELGELELRHLRALGYVIP